MIGHEQVRRCQDLPFGDALSMSRHDIVLEARKLGSPVCPETVRHYSGEGEGIVLLAELFVEDRIAMIALSRGVSVGTFSTWPKSDPPSRTQSACAAHQGLGHIPVVMAT